MGPLTLRRLVWRLGAAFTLLALMSWPAFAEGRASRLDRVLAARAGTQRHVARHRARAGWF